MQRKRFITPKVRDARMYGIGETETFPPFVPPEKGCECVWCGEALTQSTWMPHMILAHYAECLHSWLRGTKELRKDPRWGAWRRTAKYKYDAKYGQVVTTG